MNEKGVSTIFSCIISEIDSIVRELKVYRFNPTSDEKNEISP